MIFLKAGLQRSVGFSSAPSHVAPALRGGEISVPLTSCNLYLFLCLIASLVAGLPFAILTLRHSPFHRGFFCNDDSIKYPYKDDTISYQLLGGVMIPVTVLTVSAQFLFSVHFCTSFFFYSSSVWSFADCFHPLLFSSYTRDPA